MAQTAKSTRELVMERRRAMSTGGKASLQSVQAAPRPAAAASPVVRSNGRTAPAAGGSARAASLARRQAMSTSGKRGLSTSDRIREAHRKPTADAVAAPAAASTEAGDDTAARGCGCGCGGKNMDATGKCTTPRSNGKAKASKPGKRKAIITSAARAASLARRKSMSDRGKAGLGGNGMSTAQRTRAANPDMSSRDLAQVVRETRSKNGRSGAKCTDCTGQRRQRPKADTGAAADADWKVGASETTHGQTVTGTMVGRSGSVTGDEPSTCRPITGTEYLGADIFRDFCGTEPATSPRKVRTTPTGGGNVATGTRVGRSVKMTGNEPGTCKRITGTDYVGSDEGEQFCGMKSEGGPSKITTSATSKGKSVTGNNVGRSGKVTGDEVGAQRELTGTQYMQTGEGGAPAKVGISNTLRSGSVTGTMVGRSQSVTGDEPGACKNVTGDDYVGQEQYSGFCGTTPTPTDQKTGVSTTMNREPVTGTMTGRSPSVTGDEPGTCKAISGTPYAGAEQYSDFCNTDQAQAAAARMHSLRGTAGAPMTGLQPGVGGVMTGDRKGACESVSGTPYVGSDQVADACPATAAEPTSPDYPQPVGQAPWGDFSSKGVAHASTGEAAAQGSVTGSAYEGGHITGPFGMATGKVTGTEEARFGRSGAREESVAVVRPASEEERVKSRITGEGQDAGLKITGDDWERGNHVTGTEGASAKVRNPTLTGGPMSAMAPLRQNVRNEDVPPPVSKVTGSSGNTTAGSLITYSGGARG